MSENFGQVDLNKAIKISKPEETLETYSLLLNDSEANSFSNLILNKLDEDYVGYILTYRSNDIWNYNSFSDFNGEIFKYDLEGNLLNSMVVVNSSTVNGRTNYRIANENCWTQTTEYWDMNGEPCEETGFSVDDGCYEVVVFKNICPETIDAGDSGGGGGTTGGGSTTDGGGTSGSGSSGDGGNSGDPIEEEVPILLPEIGSISLEGSDQIEYDENFWEDPNLQLQQQDLPSLEDFRDAFPTKNGGQMPSSEVRNLVGGDVKEIAAEKKWSNACATRVSRALNYSGVNIPSIPGSTFKGADGKNYIVGAKTMEAFLKKTFGAPDISTSNSDEFINQSSGSGGIYIMIVNYPGWFGASGHADFFNGTYVIGGGYYNVNGGGTFMLWKL